MLDPVLRRWVDPPLDRAGAWLAARGASPQDRVRADAQGPMGALLSPARRNDRAETSKLR